MRILYLDFETTGLDTAIDRIIEVGIVLEDEMAGTRESFEALVHPGMSIPKESTAIHGITNEDLASKPPLVEVMPKIEDFFLRCDVLAGYNVSFDLKMLLAEGRRCAMPLALHSKPIWDMQRIFFHHEPRTLSAAMRFYCDKEITDAHRALGDVEATLEVFKAQKQRYGLDMNDTEVKAYAEVSLPLDSNGAFGFDEKENIVLNFGKFKGRSVSTSQQDIRNYLSWMIGASFPPDTKAIAKAIVKGKQPKRENLEQLILEYS